MTSTDPMKPLHDALNDRLDAGHRVQFWLRDDDAVEPTEPLERLIELTERFDVPITLAVIPARVDDALGKCLACNRGVTVAVHGWSHANHAPASEKKQELGLHRPVSDVVAELERGFSELAQRHAEQFVPLLVPPWNRIDAAIIQRLPSIGFQALSTYGTQTSNIIPMINTHIDVIDWKGSRGGRSVSDLVTELVTQIDNTRAPIGILTHHLVHDDNVWHFLEQLFTATSMHAGASWESVSTLVPALSPHP